MSTLSASWGKHTSRVLVRPGAGPINAIAGTFAEQLARALAGRVPQPYPAEVQRRLAATLTESAELFRPVLWRLLGDELARLVADCVSEAVSAERRSA
jgi:hypothetical protein